MHVHYPLFQEKKNFLVDILEVRRFCERTVSAQ